jgi:tetratricopeptide (TPR) repeat protein
LNPAIQQLSKQARQAAASKNWQSVKQCASKILELQRDSSEGWYLMGLTNAGVGQIPAATQAFSQSLQHDSKRYDAAIELASISGRTGKHGRAKELLDNYTDHLSNSPKYLFMAAETYSRLGLHSEAWPLYEAANAAQPNVAGIEAALATCATKVGEIDLATSLYDSLLLANPNHQRNHYERARLQTAVDGKHITAMQEVLATSNLPVEQNIFLYYALAKELEDREQWAEAFHYYQAGGDAAKQQCDAAGYSVGQDVALIDNIIAQCSKRWVQAAQPVMHLDSDRNQPIFVVGLPRTGTTLVEKIIASHSTVETADESFFLEMAIKSASRLRSVRDVTPSVIKAAVKNSQAKIAQQYFESIAYRLQGKQSFVEKYPFNFLYIGFIARYFPNAKIVLLNRNPLDACFAMYKQPFFKFSYTQADLVAYHNAYTRLMDHWHSAVGGLIEVSYESLVGDTEPQVRSLLDQLGLGFEMECVNYHQNQTASATASSVQVRQKPHTRSVGKWRNWETELDELRNGLETGR